MIPQFPIFSDLSVIFQLYPFEILFAVKVNSATTLLQLEQRNNTSQRGEANAILDAFFYYKLMLGQALNSIHLCFHIHGHTFRKFWRIFPQCPCSGKRWWHSDMPHRWGVHFICMCIIVSPILLRYCRKLCYIDFSVCKKRQLQSYC